MRAWIVRHPLIFCVGLFAAVMLTIKFALAWAISEIGIWTGIAFIAACLLIAAVMDRRDRQRDNIG